MLMESGRVKGVSFKNHPIVVNKPMNEHHDNYQALVQTFQRAFMDPAKICDFVLVVIPRKFSALYGQVKQASELEDAMRGVLTQCVVENSVYRGQLATVQNILLKLNSKLGGVNHVVMPSPFLKALKRINFLNCPMLIMGAGKL